MIVMVSPISVIFLSGSLSSLLERPTTLREFVGRISRRSMVMIRGATSFADLEKFGLNFSSSSFVIRVNLLHRYLSALIVYCYLCVVFLS